jgi:3-hydroxybutyryl-CoA dehydrogenase
MMQARHAIHSISILGAGHCGRQIAYVMSRAGVLTRCFEPTELLLETSRQQYELKFGGGSTVFWTTQIDEVCQSDLILESVPETLAIKRAALEPILHTCRSDTILASNSSYLAPSMVFRGFSNPERFAALHFHVPPWFATAVDVMPSSRTSPQVLERLTELIDRIGLTPIVLKREFPGYVFNNLLHPLLVRSMELVEREVCDPEDVERSWRAITHMPVGPFGMMLQIGLPTLRSILENAVAYLDDPGTLRAHRFLQRWDGMLDAHVCSRFSRPAVELNQFNTSGSLDRFSRYELTWEAADGGLAPLRDQLPLLRQCLESQEPSSRELKRERLLERGILVWPDFLRQDYLEFHKLQGPDVACDLIDLVMYLQRTQISKLLPDCKKSITLVWPSNSSRYSQDRPFGLQGMGRSLWLECIAKTQDAVTRVSPMEPRVQIIEIDLQSPPWRMQPETLKAESCEVADIGVADQFLHVHQRFQLGKWHVQKIRRLQCPGRALGPKPIDLRQLLHGTRWLISGGGRGITFQLALLLGENGAKLELLGRTPQPDTEWYDMPEVELQELRRETLRRAASEKGSLPGVAAAFDATSELARNLNLLDTKRIAYRYHALDVSNQQKLWNLAESLSSRGEPIDGILHGAGFEQTTLLSKKSEESIRKTISSKVRGCLNLESIVSESTRWFIQCGSLSGFFGGIGQVDYAAANGFLGARVEQQRHRWPHIQCLTIGWPGWEEVGMAARPSSKWALQNAGHALMPLQEGIRHFQWLLEHRVCGYVLICDHSEIPASLRVKGNDHHG